MCTYRWPTEERTRWAQSLDDEQLEDTLRTALRAGPKGVMDVAALRLEARRRFAGKMGLPPALMEETDRG